MSHTRTVSLRYSLTYFTAPAQPTVFLTTKQELWMTLAGQPFDRHVVTLLDLPFSSRSIQEASDIAWLHRVKIGRAHV